MEGAVFGLLDALYGQEEDLLMQQDPWKQMMPLCNANANASVHSPSHDSADEDVDVDVDANEDHAPSQNMRRIAALQRWLRTTATTTLTTDVNTLSVYERISRALHSHNTVDACLIATEHKLYHLATMLATTAVEDSVAMAEQVELWNKGGAGDVPGASAVWSILADADAVYEHADLYDILKQYLRSTNGDTNHILYRLLTCYIKNTSDSDSQSDTDTSRTNLCHPRGYTDSLHVHDMSLGWHVWQLLAALGVGDSDSDHDNTQNEVAGVPSIAPVMRMLEAMLAQLVQAGHWHWAVYMTLASQGVPRQNAVHIAKGLVLQHYTACASANEGQRQQQQKRTFLVDEVGVPDIWFEEALAQYAGFTGNITARVQHLGKAKLFNECTALIRSCVIPQCMFSGGEDRDVVLRAMLTKMADCVEADAGVDMAVKNKFWSERLGCGTMLQFIQVKERVWNLLSAEGGATADGDEQVDDILDELEALHSRMVTQHSENAGKNDESLRTGSDVYLASSTSPQYELESAFMVETMCLLSFLRLQLSLFVRGPIAGEKLLRMTLAQLVDEVCAATGKFSVDSALALDIDSAMRGVGAYVGTEVQR